MNLLDILTLDCIKAPLASSDKRGVIDELVDLLAAAGRVRDADALKDAVWTREQTRTTGIGQGLAIPHGKSFGVDRLALAIGRPAQPMDFQSIDLKPVRLVVLLASPPDKTAEHIQALSRISKLMNVEEFRESIYAAPDPSAVYELIRRAEQK